MGCRLLKMLRLTMVRASVERKGVSRERKAVSRKPLAVGCDWRGLSIVLIFVCIGAHNEVINKALFGAFRQQRGEDAVIRED
jgi:hypothetical protein